MPVSPLHAKHVTSVLKPKYRFLSPSLGLISSNSPFFINNLSSFPLQSNAPTKALIHDMFAFRNERWRPTQSKSKAAFYLNTPQRLGHILGLALDCNDKQIDSVLLAMGIETNRVDGNRTGVSLQKYKDLIQNLRLALAKQHHTPAIPMFTQLVWQRASSKHDIWAFYKTLEQHYLPDLFLNGEVDEDKFVEDNFNPAEFSSAMLQRASLDLVECEETSLQFAHSLDLIAANLSTSTWKPAWKLIKHTIPNSTKEVYDCVEVVVREFIDMLLFDEKTNTFNLWVPTMQQRARNFYLNMHQQGEEANSKEWFQIVQSIPTCDYIIDNQYELFPSLENVLKCASHVLGFERACINAVDFCAQFNALQGNNSKLSIEERREMFRPALAEESHRREIAMCTLGSLCIELTLVRSHRLATAKHSRIGGSEWVVHSRPKHMEKCMISTDSLLSSSFWPAFLQDHALTAAAAAANKQVFTWAPWGKDRDRNWSLDQSFLTSDITLQERNARDNVAQRIFFSALSTAVGLNDASIVAWLLKQQQKQQSETINEAQLAAVLTPNEIWKQGEVADCVPELTLNLLQNKWNEISLMDRMRYLYWQQKW